MNKERRPGNGHDEPVARLSDLDDEQLLAALREALGASDPPPAWCVELAKESFALRTIDAELAALTEDSALDGTALTRSARLRADSTPRFAVFDADGLNVEIEMSPGPQAGSWQLVGQLTPPAVATVGIRRPPHDQTTVTADDLGRFLVDEVPAGPLSLAIEVEGRQPVVTEWITVG